MAKQHNQVRIIGGRWRSRKLVFPSIEGLRPTSDRIRETLFNWLTPVMPGAACLDLFAGSGALGFEAASRGAARVLMLDKAHEASRTLTENCRLLDANGVDVRQVDAQDYLRSSSELFDVVFIDPPFASDILVEVCSQLQEGGWLAKGAMIYIEAPVGQSFDFIPVQWQLDKQKQAGQVVYSLYRSLV